MHLGELTRMVLSWPPRHGKSYFASELFTAWFLGRHPEQEVIIVSANLKLARKMSRNARDFLIEHGERVFGVSVPGHSSAEHWYTVRNGRKAGGSCYAVGVGGQINGIGANLIVVDDLFRDQKTARSESIREDVWEWFHGSCLARLNPFGINAVSVIGTRFHFDDHIGRIIEGGAGDGWQIMNHPAVCEEGDVATDPWGRQVGDGLWPDMRASEFYETLQATKPPATWNCVYQGKPTADSGDVFRREWFSYFKDDGAHYELADGTRIEKAACWDFASADFAVSTKARAHFSVFCHFASHKPTGALLLVNVERDRIEGADVPDRARKFMARHGCKALYAETGGPQTIITQMLRRARVPVWPMKTDKDKFERAIPAATFMQAGLLQFRAGARFLADLESELLRFPNDKYDDQVDALAHGAEAWRRLKDVQPKRRRGGNMFGDR